MLIIKILHSFYTSTTSLHLFLKMYLPNWNRATMLQHITKKDKCKTMFILHISNVLIVCHKLCKNQKYSYCIFGRQNTD